MLMIDMLMIGCAGLLVGAASAMRFRVLALAPVIILGVIVMAVFGAMSVVEAWTAVTMAILFAAASQLGYLIGAFSLLIGLNVWDGPRSQRAGPRV